VLGAGAARAFSAAVLEDAVVEIRAAVDRMLRSRPLAASVTRSAFQTGRTLPPPLLDAALEWMAAAGTVRVGGGGRILFLDRLRPLSPQDQAELARLCGLCEDAGFKPLTEDELKVRFGKPPAVFDGLLARALDEGLIERVGEYCMAAPVVRRALVAVRDNCLAHGGDLDIPALRDSLSTSRKYLIPLLEHIDHLGLTRLRNGVRVLLPASPLVSELARSAPVAPFDRAGDSGAAAR
jgi:selenocysteine-specific elongation factor